MEQFFLIETFGIKPIYLLIYLVLVLVIAFVLFRSHNLIKKLSNERNFNQEILDAIADPVFVKGSNHEWRAGNRAFSKLIGDDQQAYVGTHYSDFFIDETQPELWEKEKSVIDIGVTDINEEQILLPSGKIINTVVTRAPLVLPDGSRGLVGVVHDVSHLKNVEKQLETHKRNLEGLVAEQTVTLKKALQEAETASELKSDFLANMSHELRTPLNSIIGIAGLLLEEKLSDEQNEMMKVLEASSVNLLEIVNDILDLSKIESGALELEHIPFDAQQTISDVINMLKHLANKKDIKLNWHGKSYAPVFVTGDPLRYARVVTNIVSNAIKYTEVGQVDIRLDTEAIDDYKRMLHLTVKDTGIGIDDAALEKIFQKFTQADSSTTRKYGGTGLGLAITQQVVDRMEGTIEVESKPGVGTTFIVHIPFEVAGSLDQQEEQVIELNQSGIVPPEEAQILVAEDHQLNQIYVRKLLESIGLEHIHVAENGRLALEWVQENPVDLVLMDCHMPEMNGYDATRAIRALEGQYTDLPIIALTANAMAGERERCIRTGMNDYLSKPVDKRKLIKLLSKWIRFDEIIIDEPVKDEGSLLPVVDTSVIKSFAGSDENLEKEFVKIFVEQSEKQLNHMSEFIVDGQSKAWVETAHLLKGGAATIGAKQMEQYASKAQEMFVSTFIEREETYVSLAQSYIKVKNELAAQKLYASN